LVKKFKFHSSKKSFFFAHKMARGCPSKKLQPKNTLGLRNQQKDASLFPEPTPASESSTSDHHDKMPANLCNRKYAAWPTFSANQTTSEISFLNWKY
jgi:hypothetical protein